MTEKDIPDPKTLEEGIQQTHAWYETARDYARNMEYYRNQRNQFLLSAVGDSVRESFVTEVMGENWKNLIREELEERGEKS